MPSSVSCGWIAAERSDYIASLGRYRQEGFKVMHLDQSSGVLTAMSVQEEGKLLTPTENRASIAAWVLVIVVTLTIYGSCNTDDHDTN